LKVLILGVTGLIGSTLFKVLSTKSDLEVFGTIRSRADLKYFNEKLQKNIICDINFSNQVTPFNFFSSFSPDVIINCIGVTKHKIQHVSKSEVIYLNSVFPHILTSICEASNCRLIQISTDCVFSGLRGNYFEDEPSDCYDLYGKSKFLGEIIDSKNALTLRTSTIGHEIKGEFGLLEWFLSQKCSCDGFSGAIFSGLPTVVLANIIGDYVLPNSRLFGLFHVSSAPIDKFTLLKLIAVEYEMDIDVLRNDSFFIDRSLNCQKFMNATGFNPMEWPDLIKLMHVYK